MGEVKTRCRICGAPANGLLRLCPKCRREVDRFLIRKGGVAAAVLLAAAVVLWLTVLRTPSRESAAPGPSGAQPPAFDHAAPEPGESPATQEHVAVRPKPFEIDLGSPKAFPAAGKYITAIAQDHEGSLWFGAEGHGVVRLRGDELTHFTPKHGLADNNGYAIAADAHNNVWVGTLNHGVCRYDGQTWTTYGALDGPGAVRVYSLAVDRDGTTIWCGTENGLACFDGRKWRRFGIADGLPSREITAVAVSRTGTVWVGGAMGGLARYDGEWWEPVGLKGGLPDERVNAIHISAAGTVWVGTCNGVACYNPDKEAFEKLPDPPDRCFGPADAYVTCIGEDRNGGIWFGTRRAGLVRYDPAAAAWQSSTARSPKLPDNCVRCLAFANDGHLWFGTHGGGAWSSQAEEIPAAKEIEADGTPRAPAPPDRADWDENEYTRRLSQIMEATLKEPGDTPAALYLGEDWQTRGNWIGNYGIYYFLLGGMDTAEMTGGLGGGSVLYRVRLGRNRRDDPQGAIGKTYVEHIDDPRSLQNPREKDRRQGAWYDRGEQYPAEHDGPHLYLNLSVKEKGFFRLALYFVNYDGHDPEQQDAPGRFRDYTITIKKWTPAQKDSDPEQWPASGYSPMERETMITEEEFAAQPTLAACRVHDFAGGVYKRFLVEGPAVYRIKISRDHSRNTICSGLFLDRLAEDNAITESLRDVVPDPESFAVEEGLLLNDPVDEVALAKVYLNRARSFYAVLHEARRANPLLAAAATDHLLYLCSKLRQSIRLLGTHESTLQMQRLLVAALRDAHLPETELAEIEHYAGMWRAFVDKSGNKADALDRFRGAADEVWKLHSVRGGIGRRNNESMRDSVEDAIFQRYFETVTEALPPEEAAAKLESAAGSYSYGRARIGDKAWSMLEKDLPGFQHSYPSLTSRASNLARLDRFEESIETYKRAAELTEDIPGKAQCYEHAGRIAAVHLKDEQAARAALDVLREIAPGGKHVEVVRYYICVAVLDSADKARGIKMAEEFLATNPSEVIARNMRARLKRRLEELGEEEAKNAQEADEADASLVLYVSNQSFDVNPVDITVHIDGKPVVDQEFDVAGKGVPQHNWHKFELRLPKGKHTLLVKSKRGQAELEKEFEMKGKHWAVIDYWYYSKTAGGALPTRKHFSFRIQDQPILFQ